MKDFLMFRKMITPAIVTMFFWVGVVACVVTGLSLIISGGNASDSAAKVFWGLGYLFIGPLAVRVCCECVLLLFAMASRFAGIPTAAEEKNEPAAADVTAIKPRAVINPIKIAPVAKQNNSNGSMRPEGKTDTLEKQEFDALLKPQQREASAEKLRG